MAKAASLALLVTALKDHDIPLGQDDVQSAFESVQIGSDMTAWAEEYLQQTTLLSKEELELYQAISKTTATKFRTAGTETKPIYDQELRTALRALDKSTVAIEDQCKTLEAQMQSVRALRDLSTVPSARDKRRWTERSTKQSRDIKSLNSDVDEEFDSVKGRLVTLQKDVGASASALISHASERLGSDDRKLKAVSQLTSKVQPESSNAVDSKAVESWCHALVSFRTSEIKTNVDIELHKKLSESSHFSVAGPDESLSSEKEALKDELEMLHAEVSSVLSMVVDHELKTPILQGRRKADTVQHGVERQWLNYIFSTLECMTARLRAIDECACELRGLRSVTDATTSAVNDILINQNSTTEDLPASTQVERKSSSTALKGTYSRIMRTLNASSASEEAETTSEPLKIVLLERAAKLQEYEKSTAVANFQSLVDVLGNADREILALLRSLYTNTAFNQLSLSHQAQASQLNKLEADIERTGKGMSTLDISSGQESARKAELVAKWS